MDNNTLFHIFFTITAAAVIIITILLAIAAIYIISIIRSVRRAVRTAEIAAEIVKEDVVALRDDIRTKGLSAGVITGFLRRLSRRRVSSKRK